MYVYVQAVLLPQVRKCTQFLSYITYKSLYIIWLEYNSHSVIVCIQREIHITYLEEAVCFRRDISQHYRVLEGVKLLSLSKK